MIKHGRVVILNKENGKRFGNCDYSVSKTDPGISLDNGKRFMVVNYYRKVIHLKFGRLPQTTSALRRVRFVACQK